MITRLIISTLAVLITAYTLSGVTVEPWWWAVIIAVVLGFVNSCIRPLVKFVALPINMLTLGLFTFVINGLMVLLCMAGARWPFPGRRNRLGHRLQYCHDNRELAIACLLRIEEEIGFMERIPAAS